MADDRFELETFLPYRLNRAAETIGLDFAKLYKDRHAMTRTEWRVLAHLGQSGTLTASEIGARAGLHKTKVSRAVRALEERRWLRRQTDDDDRRIEHLTLTGAGLSACRELGALAAAHDAQLRSRLTADELGTLETVLRKLETPEPG